MPSNFHIKAIVEIEYYPSDLFNKIWQEIWQCIGWSIEVLTGWSTIVDPCLCLSGFIPSTWSRSLGSPPKKWGNDTAAGISVKKIIIRLLIDSILWKGGFKKIKAAGTLTVVARSDVRQPFRKTSGLLRVAVTFLWGVLLWSVEHIFR